jgi:hypothetical protein
VLLERNLEERGKAGMLETINWLALTVPFIVAGAAYTTLQEKSVSKALAATIACCILAAVFGGFLVTAQVPGSRFRLARGIFVDGGAGF